MAAPTPEAKFSWIPIYSEFARKLLAYRSRQTELIKT